VAIAVNWSNFLCRKGKAPYEHPFELHRQQPEKHKQNVDVSPLENILWTPMEKGLGAILTKVCQSLPY